MYLQTLGIIASALFPFLVGRIRVPAAYASKIVLPKFPFLVGRIRVVFANTEEEVKTSFHSL